MKKRNPKRVYGANNAIKQKPKRKVTSLLSGSTFIADIIQAKVNEQELQILEALQQAIYLTDVKGNLMYYNSAAAEFSGREPELGNDRWCVSWKLYYPDGSPMPHEESPMAVAIKEERSINGTEIIVEQLNGERVWFEAYPSPVYDDEGNVIGGLNMFVDITSRKQTKQQIQQANNRLEGRAKEHSESLLGYQKQLRFLASKLSKAEEKERHRLATELHDNLGQMLAVAKMKIDLIQQDVCGEPVTSSVSNLQKLLEDSLSYTRELMSDLKPPPTLDKEDIRVTIKWLAKKMRKHHLRITVDDDGKPKCTSEEIRIILLQCVRELFFNILEHAEVSKAHVRLARDEEQIQIVVEDKGKGFDVDAIISTSTKEKGFGLFNINERIDLVGGSMDVSSDPGRGTQIILRVPLKKKAAI